MLNNVMLKYKAS